MDSPPIDNGAVVVKNDRVTAVGPAPQILASHSGQVTDLGEVILLPGLINSHCHLDYTMMRHAILPPQSFTAWIQRINAVKRSLDSQDYLTSIQQGFAELQRWGTTAVCNIEAFPELMPLLGPSPIRTWWFYEMIDIRHRLTPNDVVAGALGFFKPRENSLDYFGLSPHSPFTASTDLYALANTCAEVFNMPLTTHLAESAEEMAMFLHASGPLYDFLASLQRPMTDCGHSTPFALLWNSQSIHRRWILAHLNELAESDFALLASLPKNSTPTVVHCPGSHRYFSHSPFPYRRLHDLGLNLCTATDSLASTSTLSLFEELRSLSQSDPWLSPNQLLQTVTLNPAKALRHQGQLGQITPGALADLIAIPHSDVYSSILPSVIHYSQPVPWTMINGQIRS